LRRPVNPRPKRRTVRRFLSTILVVGLGLVFLRFSRDSNEDTDGIQANPPGAPGSTPDLLSPGERQAYSESIPPLQTLLGEFPGRTGSARHLAIRTLESTLKAAPARESTEFIQSVLETEERIPTGQAFVVGRNGSLVSTPDLRSYLLHLLEEINPDAALIEAHRFLDAPTHPDEWAIALQVVSRQSDPRDPYLQDRILRLLAMNAWLTSPTVAFLQAFDASVYSTASGITERLLEIADADYPAATRFAARLALERKAESNYASTASLIIQTTRLGGQPAFRAALIARGDVRSVTERSVLETYLQGLDTGSAEGRAFAGVFPNYNQQVSDNLITSEPLTSIEDRMDQDRVTLAWIRTIRNQSAFAPVRDLLDRVETRLVGYLASTAEVPPENDS